MVIGLLSYPFATTQRPDNITSERHLRIFTDITTWSIYTSHRPPARQEHQYWKVLQSRELLLKADVFLMSRGSVFSQIYSQYDSVEFNLKLITNRLKPRQPVQGEQTRGKVQKNRQSSSWQKTEGKSRCSLHTEGGGCWVGKSAGQSAGVQVNQGAEKGTRTFVGWRRGGGWHIWS